MEQDLDGIHAQAETGNVSVDAILNAKLSLVLKQVIDLNLTATVSSALTAWWKNTAATSTAKTNPAYSPQKS